MELQDLKMYLVRNSSGQYYRRIGYGGYGACWVDDVASASVWTKLSTARSRVTYFANNYPQYPVPSLIAIHAGQIEIVDETVRIEKAKATKARAEARQAVWRQEMEIQRAKEQMEQAKKAMHCAQFRLDQLKGDA